LTVSERRVCVRRSVSIVSTQRRTPRGRDDEEAFTADIVELARPHVSIGYKSPALEVFVPAFAAGPAAQPRPAQPAMLTVAPKPTMN